MNKTQKTLYIKGMHCVSCEMLIKQSIDEIDGAKVLSISSRKGTLDVEFSDKTTLHELENTIREAGYSVIDGPSLASDSSKNYSHLVLSIIIVGILFAIAYKLNVLQYLPSMTGKLSFGVALIMGVVASLSTCLAIVGSIVIGFSEYLDKTSGTSKHVQTQLLFQAGRIGGFFVLGGLLGLLGQAISVSLTTTTILTIIVGCKFENCG